MDAVIQIDDLYKRFGKEPNVVEALKGVSFRVNEGEFVAICGASGSGKSTLMNIIGLIDNYDEGSYALDGIDMKKRKDNEYAKIRNEKIGFVFQKFNLIAKYTALYNVALPLILRGATTKLAKEKAHAMLKKVGLEDRVNHRPNQLSGGQQQRVAIARALVGDCSLILADEPTGNLDKTTGKEVVETLIKLNEEGKTIILITHDWNVASKASRVLELEDGRFVNESKVDH